MDVIKSIKAREILNAVGRPTVEATVETNNGFSATASVPSGTSKGRYEAKELYDGEPRFRGFGVRKAVENVNRVMAPELIGFEVAGQKRIDETLVALDGTPDKQRLGSNAILAVSLATARAAARSLGLPLYRYLGGDASPVRIPSLLSTVIAGGKHADSGLAFEDYMLVFRDFESFSTSTEALMEIRHHLKTRLKEKYPNLPEKGGAFSPPVESTEEAFEHILNAVEKAGSSRRISIGLDVVGSDLYDPEKGLYRIDGKDLSARELIGYYETLVSSYPVTMIEDPFHEDDFENFASLTAALPGIRIVGDDLFTTNPSRIRQGVKRKAANSVLLKVNQVGTLTEAMDANRIAVSSGYHVIVSTRSSDTNDDFISDLAVGIGAEQIKLGSPVRGERSAKFNRLLAIEQEIAPGPQGM